MKQIFGGILISLPFIAITILMVKSIGWKGMLLTWGITLAIVAIALGGVYLTMGGL